MARRKWSGDPTRRLLPYSPKLSTARRKGYETKGPLYKSPKVTYETVIMSHHHMKTVHYGFAPKIAPRSGKTA